MDNNFYPILYTRKTVPEMLVEYSTPMFKKQNPIARFKAKRLLAYRKLLLDKEFFDQRIQDVFFNLYKMIDKRFPELTYELSGRIKGLISTINKIEETEESLLNQLKAEFVKSELGLVPEMDEEAVRASITSALESDEDSEIKKRFDHFLGNHKFDDNPFNRIRDFFAFRVIIEDEGKGDMIDELYEVTNLMIEFFNSEAFEVVESHPLIQTGLGIKSDIIHVPKTSGIKDEYKKLVKDYVLSPKRDGYQSVHFVVYDPVNERYFEVQVRTRSMDIISETLANHDAYKEKRYGERLQKVGEELDLSKIHVKGFRYFKYNDPATGEEKEYISDKAGITKSIAIKLEFEHFLTL